MAAYRTIDRPLGGTAEAEIVVLRSRFLARAGRVEDEASARSLIAEVRATHHDARHHCTAFVIGPDGSLRRSNDDGEPSGTAGRPILEVVSGREVSDVVVVVTRWFGGTLLGAGGLGRAYGDATAAVLDVAGTRERVLWRRARIVAPVAEVGALENRLRRSTDVIEVSYGAEQVTYEVAAPDLGVLDRLEYEELDPVWRDA
ncbi:YigZ family protein [Aeromicrobium senzhongii]|uniref:YigZ family protein n=1 Tax=Aeromicrobium senzhongii TaxID=2663859 RepID=A0ABX6SZ33_9ACTN|nr:YigZ family protein [Aeromicrobium senzhongii]MTB89381.1 YigZ family protein [Aeromicrobium senzhongii]QNL94470.1 YigZ family protein [Aeromicrobium senzhongii]